MSKIKVYIAKSDKLGADIIWQRETGKILLKNGLHNFLGNDKFIPNVKRSKCGKPYLANSDLHFNISHSQRYVVCAIGDEELGVDIQFHKKSNVDTVAKKIMSAIEWQEYQNIDDKMKFFYDLWAKKESYLKYNGDGIRSDMRLLDIDACIQEIVVDEMYSCMLCTQKECEYELKCQ